MDRRFVLRGKKMLSSELRPNESAGWIKEDLSKTRGRRRKFGERAASTEGEGRVSAAVERGRCSYGVTAHT